MSLSIATSVASGTWALEHEASSSESRRPEVDDQVLVSFAHGELHSPVVIAPLWDSAAEPPTSSAAPEAGHPDSQKDMTSNKLDSLSEMGEMESLRLQMAMDRLSKMMSTLSNILHKASETQAAITPNLK
jgi:uncharacterized protein involved in type VI secretion and phage assembly